MNLFSREGWTRISEYRDLEKFREGRIRPETKGRGKERGSQAAAKKKI